ncbi:MAG TPA: trigger factor [Candidatus Saccharimonadales bacterium]|nr:trigger factor [Candidatus Saccharimonadales bacterium]
MQVSRKDQSETSVQLTLTADAKLLDAAKQEALKHVAKNLKLQGFREGKAPMSLVEKSADPATLQSEFLDIAMNRMYGAALDEEKLRPVAQPKVTVKKFVPFTELELEAEVEVIGKIKLADYKKVKVEKPAVKITAKEVDEVLTSLRTREAEKKDVKRAAKDGDEITIDFKGTDSKTGEAIQGADGKAYPLVLGSNTFIPGFEPELIGLKAGDKKTFDITFPKDYGVAALQNRAVTFAVTVIAVKEVVEPKLDDAFAAKVGPFKTVAELKEDVKKQLQTEKDYQADREFVDKLLTTLGEKSTVAIPAVLIDEQLERMEAEERQNIMYRGQTWQEHLDAEGVTADEHRERLRPDAEMRVKAGLVLAEIAEAEKINVTPEELEVRMQLMKGQYPDPQMQAELDKPENRRDIVSRMMSEKTIDKLKEYAAKAA